MFLEKTILTILFLLQVVMTIQAQPDAVMRLPVPERYIQIDTFFEHRAYDPASLSVIETWKKVAVEQHDPKSLLLLELRRFIVLREMDPTNPALPHMIDSILRVAHVFDEPYIILSTHIHSAWWHHKIKDFPAAFEHYLEAYALMKDFSPTYYYYREYSLYSIALAFYEFNDFEKALEIGKQVKATSYDPFTLTLTTNMLGMCYLKTANYDSARYWFSECLKTVSSATLHTGWEGLIKGNLGYTWYEQKEYDKAIPLFEEGITKTNHDSIWDNTVGFCCALADIYLKRNDITKAKIYLHQAEAVARLAGDDDSYFKLHQTLSQFYRQTGDYARALHEQDSMLLYKSIIETATDSKLKVQAEYKFEIQHRIAEADMLKAQTAKQKLIRNLIIGILFLLMVLSLLYFNRRELKHRFLEKQLLSDKKQAEKELANAQTQLYDFTRSLKEKNQLIEKFSSEITKLQSLPCNVITPEQSETLNELRLSAILTDKDWEEFRNRFEKVHGGFLQRLRLKLPDLSPAETRFMALAKLQLNNKEMGSILGISPDSIRTIRYRLRKKLQLEEEGSMEELLGSI